MFTKLPIPTGDGVPDGYSLIVAYGKGDTVVVPIDPRGLADENHNCDWEGCSTMHHVVRFSVLHKYAAEEGRTVRQETPPCPACIGFGTIPPHTYYCKTCGRKLPEHGMSGTASIRDDE